VWSALSPRARRNHRLLVDVTFDGKPVARAMDMMLGNKGGTFNTPPAPLIQPPMPPDPAVPPDDKSDPDRLVIQLVDRSGAPSKTPNMS